MVFELDTSGHETVLYTFTGGNDGANPNNVVRDRKGNIYGTDLRWRSMGGAPVWSLRSIPQAIKTVLYTFTGGADGADPNPVELDSLGNLYGTTNYGGNKAGTSGAGVVFKVDPSGHETVLYTFTRRGSGGGHSEQRGPRLER